jgi:hypothetical protein
MISMRLLPASATTERREFLRRAALSVGGGALAASAAPALACSSAVEEEALGYDEFLAAAVPLARELKAAATRFGEDRYLFALAALAVRLRAVDVPELRRVNREEEPGYWLGANEAPEDCPFTVLHWKLAPGAIVRPHPHTYGNVVTLGLEGEVRIQNHETVEAPDYAATGTFQLRRVHEQILRPHDVNLVPLHHGFIHGFVAGPEGARGLDITTRVRPKQPNVSVEIGDAVDLARGIFEGRWVR